MHADRRAKSLIADELPPAAQVARKGRRRESRTWWTVISSVASPPPGPTRVSPRAWKNEIVSSLMPTAIGPSASSSISLTAPVGVSILAIGFGLALLGGLVAGMVGALRAARLRPADALRTVE